MKKRLEPSLQAKSSDYIREYNRQIQSGEVIACDKIKRIYAKLVADLDNKDSVWVYDEGKGMHPIQFIECFCKHSKGAMGGQKVLLELWEKAFIAAAFGFINKVTGLRKYKEVFLCVARKNGKSLLASALGNYMLMADGESGADIVSVATKHDQAKIIWSEAVKMIKKSPTLLKFCKCHVGEIVCTMNEGSFKPLSSDSNTLDGLNVHASLIDEMHAIEDRNLYDVIIDGMSARKQPMSIITTTAGTVREGVFDQKYDECCGVLDGTIPNERLLPIIYELDNREEWIDPTKWKKANPGLGTIKQYETLAEKVESAKKDARLVKNLVTKDFNVRDTSIEAWLTFEQIDNTATFDMEDMRDCYCAGGVDLSSTTDLTCATILCHKQGDSTLYVKQMYWLPEALLETRCAEDIVPYDVWLKQGLLRTTPGNKINYHYVTEWFVEMAQQYNLCFYSIGYDSWSATYFVDEMNAQFGTSVMEAVIQGKKTLSAPMKSLGADLEAKRINYNNNPILKWCLSNTCIDVDRNDNIQPAKGKVARKRIDGAASLLDAYTVVEKHKEEMANYL